MTPLASVADLSAYLQREVDAQAGDLALKGASGLIRHYCRWPISQETTTFTLDGTGTPVVGLPTLNLTAVTAVRVEGDAVTDYAFSRGGLVERTDGGIYPRSFRAVEVDATHGYADVPDEIRIVTLALATRYLVNPESLRSKTVGAISRSFVMETMRGELTDLQTSLIAGYRLP